MWYHSGSWIDLAVNYLQEAEQERTEDNPGVDDQLGGVRSGRIFL